jgi:pyridoxamine 5'-phosphate oxidase
MLSTAGPQPSTQGETMSLQDCLEFANQNPACFLSTMDGDQPRVRTVQMMFANESGFHFALLSPKQVSKQLKVNPKVEICFFNHASDLQQAKQLRVTGRMELVNDETLKKKVVAERDALSAIAGQPIGPLTEIWRVPSGEAHFWTIMDVMKEPTLERIRF